MDVLEEHARRGRNGCVLFPDRPHGLDEAGPCALMSENFR